MSQPGRRIGRWERCRGSWCAPCSYWAKQLLLSIAPVWGSKCSLACLPLLRCLPALRLPTLALGRPVEEGAEGERLRIEVGPVGSRELRTFVFSKVSGHRWAVQPGQTVARVCRCAG